MFYPKQKTTHRDKEEEREEGAISLFACVRAQGKSLFPCRLCLCAGWAATCRVTGADSGWRGPRPGARSGLRRQSGTRRRAAAGAVGRGGAGTRSPTSRRTTPTPSGSPRSGPRGSTRARRSAWAAPVAAPSVPGAEVRCLVSVHSAVPASQRTLHSAKMREERKTKVKERRRSRQSFLSFFCFPFFFFVFESCARREGVCEDRWSKRQQWLQLHLCHHCPHVVFLTLTTILLRSDALARLSARASTRARNSAGSSRCSDESCRMACSCDASTM